ncbi:hypothetical protein PR001_g2525 [Phytophthora rubi]|uniref:Uncharacterized protein n=1 Tax=Phytophthora rubi TaxID=129364 RepID=A0A6A3P4I2_9STRA|nr:hypothetical protein PR001_g2525 [Phytophthora rubi]
MDRFSDEDTPSVADWMLSVEKANESVDIEDSESGESGEDEEAELADDDMDSFDDLPPAKAVGPYDPDLLDYEDLAEMSAVNPHEEMEEYADYKVDITEGNNMPIYPDVPRTSTNKKLKCKTGFLTKFFLVNLNLKVNLNRSVPLLLSHPLPRLIVETPRLVMGTQTLMVKSKTQMTNLILSMTTGPSSHHGVHKT